MFIDVAFGQRGHRDGKSNGKWTGNFFVIGVTIQGCYQLTLIFFGKFRLVLSEQVIDYFVYEGSEWFHDIISQWKSIAPVMMKNAQAGNKPELRAALTVAARKMAYP